MRKVLWAICGILAFITLNGCTQRLLDYTALTSKNIDVSAVKRGERYSGEDCAFNLLFIPFGIPNWKTAMDEALEKGKGDVLLDVVLVSKTWWFIVGQNCVEITGTVSQTASYRR